MIYYKIRNFREKKKNKIILYFVIRYSENIIIFAKNYKTHNTMADAVITIKSIFGGVYSWTWDEATGVAKNTASGITQECKTRQDFFRFVFDRAEDFGHTIIGVAG